MEGKTRGSFTANQPSDTTFQDCTLFHALCTFHFATQTSDLANCKGNVFGLRNISIVCNACEVCHSLFPANSTSSWTWFPSRLVSSRLASSLSLYLYIYICTPGVGSFSASQHPHWDPTAVDASRRLPAGQAKDQPRQAQRRAQRDQGRPRRRPHLAGRQL